jgi:hypothetical protein
MPVCYAICGRVLRINEQIRAESLLLEGYNTEYLPRSRSRTRYTLAGTRFSPKQLWLGSRLTATFVSSQPPPLRLDLPSNGATTPTPTPQPLCIYRRRGSSRSSSFDISLNRLYHFTQT